VFLDVVSATNIPVASEAAGLTSAVMYAVGGDWVGAGLAVVGVVPAVGTAADVARLARLKRLAGAGPSRAESMGPSVAAASNGGRLAATGGDLVIGRGSDLAKPGALQAGEYKLGWPTQLPDYKAEWKENAGRLREAMRQGRPIRDASPGNTGGVFLNAERNLLRDRGWIFDPATNVWTRPGT
jgi:hypothetical protein